MIPKNKKHIFSVILLPVEIGNTETSQISFSFFLEEPWPLAIACLLLGIYKIHNSNKK
jgi:hypothetical protein